MAYVFNNSLRKTTVNISNIPGDKSISHRSIILGSLASNGSMFTNFLFSEDCLNTIKIFQAMGVSIVVDPLHHRVKIKGSGLKGLKEPKNKLDVGNSGTSIRLISGILVAQSFESIISGDSSIEKRPMKRIIDPLTLMGASISGQSTKVDESPPLKISPVSSLKGIDYTLPVASAQVKSSILLAGLYAEGETTVHEPKKTRDHTENMFKAFNVPISRKDSSITISKPETLENPFDEPVVIPSDFSSSAFFIVLGLIQDKVKLSLSQIGINPTRAALIDVLKLMGADISIKNEQLKLEPYADIDVSFSSLKNIVVDQSVIPFIIDEIPILAVAAMFGTGTLVIRGAKELRFKESDRIKKTVHLISQFGGTIIEKPDGFDLEGGFKPSAPEIKTDFDHRIAMSAVVASLALDQPVLIDDISCTTTSFPNFFDIIKTFSEI